MTGHLYAQKRAYPGLLSTLYLFFHWKYCNIIVSYLVKACVSYSLSTPTSSWSAFNKRISFSLWKLIVDSVLSNESLYCDLSLCEVLRLNYPKICFYLKSVGWLLNSVHLSSLPAAHLSDACRRRLVVTRDSARIQDETAESSVWFFNVLGVKHRHTGPRFNVSSERLLVIFSWPAWDSNPQPVVTRNTVFMCPTLYLLSYIGWYFEVCRPMATFYGEKA